MAPFINFDFDKSVTKENLIKHIQFSLFWLFLLLAIFRIDLLLFPSKSTTINETLSVVLPTLAIGTFIIFLYFQKWGFKLAFLFYPLLNLLWFLPKCILRKGKVYLLVSYINLIGDIYKRFLKFLILFLLFGLTIFMLLVFDNDVVRWFGIIFMSLTYLIVFRYYIKKNLRKSFVRGNINDDVLKRWIDRQVKLKGDEKFSMEERNEKQLLRLAKWNFVCEYIMQKLNDYNVGKAYVASWIYILGLFISASVALFWFINYQLYLISEANFIVTGSPDAFDFLIYTVSSVIAKETESIKALSNIANIIDISSFVVIGIVTLIFFLSILLPISKKRNEEEVKVVVDLSVSLNNNINNYTEANYNISLPNIKNKDAVIKATTDIEKFLSKIF